MTKEEDPGFLSRWSRRKAQARSGTPAPAPVANDTGVQADAPAGPVPAAATAAPGALPPSTPPDAPPPPTLDDVAQLTRDSDYGRFVARGVDPGVRNAALKKLFSDPHFNVMDGLDIYIDDYGKPDPLPAGMLRQLAQGRSLGLFADDPPSPQPPAAEAPAPLAPTKPAPDEDPDLRLQPDDAAGRDGGGPDQPGPGEDPAGQR